MFKKQSIKNDINFIIERTKQMHYEMEKWYNRLHTTTFIPKENLLVSRHGKAKTFNQDFFALHTIFRETKSTNQKVKNKSKFDATEHDISLLELSFIKIKNIKILVNDTLPQDYSLKNMTKEKLSNAVISAYLSLDSKQLHEEIKVIEGRERAYQHLIKTFLEDIKDNYFIFDEIQTEIAKHLTALSEQLGANQNEETFWNNLSSSIAKHYILPLLIKEIVK